MFLIDELSFHPGPVAPSTAAKLDKEVNAIPLFSVSEACLLSVVFKEKSKFAEYSNPMNFLA